MPKSIKNTSSKADRVLADMTSLRIFEKDIEEEFVVSPGPGGQNVNKVATCVVLKHFPSGEVVKCSEYRTQLANRVRAREVLIERIRLKKETKRQEARQRQHQERARKRKRSAKSKEKMLEQKRQRSERKQSRKKISFQKIKNEL